MFATRIKNLRQSRELNQVQLAEKLGVKKQSISNWENDNIMPSIEMLIKIADFFHVSTDYLLGREMQKTSVPQILDITGLRGCLKSFDSQEEGGDNKRKTRKGWDENASISKRYQPGRIWTDTRRFGSNQEEDAPKKI